SQTVRDMRIHNVWDGIRPSPGAAPQGKIHNYISGAWISEVFDDSIEDDGLASLDIDDTLFDGVNNAISADRGGGADPADYGPTDTITFNNSLIGLRPESYPALTSDGLDQAAPFKFKSYSPSLVLNNTTISLYEFTWERNERWNAGWAKVKSCKNNYL